MNASPPDRGTEFHNNTNQQINLYCVYILMFRTRHSNNCELNSSQLLQKSVGCFTFTYLAISYSLYF